jgi:cobalt-zinc-cadmium efflux system membrane fusion protein
MKMNKLILYIVLFTIVSMGVNCSKKEVRSASEHPAAFKLNINNDTIKVSKKDFIAGNFELIALGEKSNEDKVTCTGVIEVPPNGRAVISAQVGGYIKNSKLLIGDQVKKGDLLVSIENIEFLEMQQEYLETLEQLAFLKSNYDRQSELFKEQISSEKAFLKAQSDYKRTFAIHAGLKKKLELLNINIAAVEKGELSSISSIYAPISGDVSEINVKTGSFVASSNAIMEIVNTEHVHLELKIFEKDALRIKKGQKVIFRLPESSGENYFGTVHLIGKSIAADRTVTAHIHIEEEGNPELIPGMFVQAEIIIGSTTDLMIKETALFEEDGRYYILKKVSNQNDIFRFVKTKVFKGNTSNGDVVVSSDQILIEGKIYLNGVND